MRSFLSPKKSSKDKTQPTAPQPAQHLPENLARYLKSDGTLARAFTSFKDVAGRCDTWLFEMSYLLIGQNAEVGNTFSTLQVGEIVLQLFRLPPLPRISPSQLTDLHLKSTGTWTMMCPASLTGQEVVHPPPVPGKSSLLIAVPLRC